MIISFHCSLSDINGYFKPRNGTWNFDIIYEPVYPIGKISFHHMELAAMHKFVWNWFFSFSLDSAAPIVSTVPRPGAPGDRPDIISAFIVEKGKCSMFQY